MKKLLLIAMLLFVGCNNDIEYGIEVYGGDQESYMAILDNEGLVIQERYIDEIMRVNSNRVVDTIWLTTDEDCIGDSITVDSPYKKRTGMITENGIITK